MYFRLDKDQCSRRIAQEVFEIKDPDYYEMEGQYICAVNAKFKNGYNDQVDRMMTSTRESVACYLPMIFHSSEILSVIKSNPFNFRPY